jgi:hypothetical protein
MRSRHRAGTCRVWPLWSAILLPALLAAAQAADEPATFRGRVLDASTGQALPARIYIQSEDGRWFFARSTAPDGSAVEYRKQRGETSVEMHTTLSAHAFSADLPPGSYMVTIERGKEYLPVSRTIRVAPGRAKHGETEFLLRRWIDMPSRGWYSGDTHVHRGLEELPNVMLAEDLNVALPLTYWVTQGRTPPTAGDKTTATAEPPRLLEVDRTHVIWPLNTEYEIFTIAGRPHTLGAVFVLNHREPLQPGAPPVGPIAREARRQGALLDLDKHSWPWSLMLVPVMDVDLFELANNHVWRTEFFFRQWTLESRPESLQLETDAGGLTERGWLDYGFGTYYALLNCGFRLRPTAGTASGVHPVPLGFGRVYVHLPEGFSYDGWIAGLDAGRSFVTTGPMLFAEFNGQPPGHTFRLEQDAKPACRVAGSAESSRPLDRIELLANGEIRSTIRPANARTPAGGYRSPFDESLQLDGSAWVAVRCFEQQPDGRQRFAHTAPVHIDVPGQPLRPRPAEVAWLVRRMEEELARNQDVLQPAELNEYRQALEAYRRIQKSGGGTGGRGDRPPSTGPVGASPPGSVGPPP